MADLADIIMQVYALESALLRARKLALRAEQRFRGGRSGDDGTAGRGQHGVAEQAARRVLAACGEGDMLRTQLAILRRLAKSTPVRMQSGLSRSVARYCIGAEKYPL